MNDDRRPRIGAAGEAIAAFWLQSQGVRVVANNVEVAGGEIDLIVEDNGARVVVEVRTTTSPGDPIDAVNNEKRRRVRSLASRLGASRVDFLGVSLLDDAIEIHWVPG